jgi:sulfoxide reductase heme-binding subunit YedZ
MAVASLSPRTIAVLKAVVFVVALIPIAHLAYSAIWNIDALGANPAEFITRSVGDWTLRFLLLTLAVTPVRKLLGWPWLARLRRMLGLYTFFYAVVHFCCYIAFDHVFEMAEIVKDVLDRPFITLGFIALLLLVPLAVTSTNRMVKRLGAQRWIALHRLVYVIALLGVTHFWMMVKRDITEPAIYAMILALLLGYRLWDVRRRRIASTGAVRGKANAAGVARRQTV